MLQTISLPIGSVLFTSVLLIVYIHKSKVAKHRNNYFLALLILLLGVLLSEIGTYFAMMQMDKHPFINIMMARTHGIVDLAWTICMGAYIYSFYRTNSRNKNAKNNTKVFWVIFIVASIISFFMPFEFKVNKDTAYLDGLALGFLYTIGVGVVVASSIIVLTNQRHVLFSQTFPIIVAIVETSITVPASLAFPSVYIITTSFAFKLYLIYFTLENPDLYLIKQLQSAKKKADDSSKAKSDFLSNMSNEIRNPMNAILEYSDVLLNEEGFNKEEDIKTIQQIYAAGGSLIEIINNILDISKIESGEGELVEREYNLASIILELHSLIDARLANTKVRFISNVDETIPVKIHGDKAKLFQVLLNLLSNAVKYTEIGRIELKVKGEIVKDEVILHFRISDTGIGIKTNDYKALIEKLDVMEADNSRIEGSGLGLLISKKLVNILGGKIWFESRYGAGTDFYVDVTQRIIDRTMMGNVFNSEAKDDGIKNKFFDCSKYKVLIVDDNELNLKVARTLLAPYKFEVTTLNKGKDCVDLIKSGEEYDLIFLDHMMPGMDGIEVMHILKSLETYNIPPIIALTANAVTGMREMYLKEGFDDYLSKPINVNDLNTLLEKYFKK